MPTLHDQVDDRLVLKGRIVTMDSPGVIKDGLIYIRSDSIVAVCLPSGTSPPGFDGVEPFDTGGTIYPGLIELHTHLAYNMLPLWTVPDKFTNRMDWQHHDA